MTETENTERQKYSNMAYLKKISRHIPRTELVKALRLGLSGSTKFTLFETVTSPY